MPSTTPYITSSRLSIAPLRYGAGVKGKVGEALAHGLPVVTTSIGSEGMDLVDGEDVLVADGAEAFADAVVRAYRDPQLWERLRHGGRDKLLEPLRHRARRGGVARAHRPRHSGATFLAVPPASDPAALATVLRSYLEAFDSDDPVSLVLGLREATDAVFARSRTSSWRSATTPVRFPT